MRGRTDNTFKFVAMPSKAQPRREGSWWLRGEIDGRPETDEEWRQRVKAKSLSFALSTADEMNQYAVKETA